MAGNTGDEYRNGSVTNRIQRCDPITKQCTKYDTETGKVLATKDGPFKGVAICNDDRSEDRTNSFCYKDSSK